MVKARVETHAHSEATGNHLHVRRAPSRCIKAEEAGAGGDTTEDLHTPAGSLLNSGRAGPPIAPDWRGAQPFSGPPLLLASSLKMRGALSCLVRLTYRACVFRKLLCCAESKMSPKVCQAVFLRSWVKWRSNIRPRSPYICLLFHRRTSSS